jgi:hypothetical protein
MTQIAHAGLTAVKAASVKPAIVPEQPAFGWSRPGVVDDQGHHGSS